MTYLATATLFLTVATLLVVGGVLFAPFLLGVFLLSLFGVLARHSDRRVHRQEPSMDPRGWRGRV